MRGKGDPPVVAKEDPVGIEHGYDLEDDVVPENLGDGVSTDEEVHETLANEGRRRFAGMNPGEDRDDSPLSVVALGLTAGDRHELHLPLLYGRREGLALHRAALRAQVVQVAEVPCVRIRICEGELVDVFLPVEVEGEAENMMVLMLSRLVVEHLRTGDSLPAGFARALDERRHPIAKQGPAPRYVDDVEDHALIGAHVVDGEVEPEPQTGTARIRSYE